MFNFKKISKVILVAGALAFASFYSHSSQANGQGTEEYNASTYGEGASRSLPALGGPAGITTSGAKTPSTLSAPSGVKNKLEMAGKGNQPVAPVLNTSSTVPTNIKLNQSSITGRISESDADGNTKAKYDSAKKRLDSAESDYQKELKRLNGLISEDGISKSDKKKYQDQISTLKSNYKKEKNAAIKELSAANSAYQKEQLDNASQMNVDASRDLYTSARTDYNNLAKELAECSVKGSCPADLNSRMEAAKKKADEAYSDYKTAQIALDKQKTSQSQEIQKSKSEVEQLRSELQNAQKGCEYYEMNGAVSKAAKADKKKLCDDAKVLEEKLRAAEEKLFEAQQAAQDVGGIGDEHEGEIYAAFSTTQGNKSTIFDGTYRGYASYDKTDGNVLQTVTRRAARIIVALKPIVYVFAGFGLIGFAFMAIFNKLSWKWFANIAMGLFLVANMGRFIEYFVFKGEGLGENDALKFGSFVEGKEGLSRTKISEAFADTKYQWVEESAFYIPPKGVGGELQASIPSLEEEDSKARGFCGKTEGASGWGNFASCIKDITSAGKKAVDAAKTAKNTLDTVKNGVESVKFAAQNIGDAAKNIGKSGSIEGVFNAFSQIGNNVNNMVGTAGGVVNGVMSNASRISNDIQDVSKSTDQVAELNKKRAKGEGTNAIDRALKGQKTGADGSVERLYGGTDQHGNAISGKVASDRNILTDVKNTTDTVVQKSKEANSMFQGVNSTVSAAASVVSNTSLSDLTMGLAKNDTTLNNKLQDKRKNEQARANEKRVQERETKRQQEAERKRQEKAEAEAAKEKEQSAAAQKKAEDDYINSFLNKAVPDGSAKGKAETAVEEAKKQAAEAQKAEAELSNKQKALEKAEKDANTKASDAERLEKAAEAARLKADRSGSEADKKAADLAAGRAQTARAQADQATLQAKNAKEAHEIAAETYEKAKEPLSDMADKARAAAIEAAKEAKADAEKKAKAAADSLTKAQESATKQQDKVKEKQSEYEKAVQKAKETNSREDILAVQAAENELNKAKNQLSNFQDQVNTNKKQKQAAEEKAAAAEVFAKKVEAEKDYGLTKDVEKQLQKNDKVVEEIRETYTKESTPDKIAEKASAAAEKAKIAAAAAESKAKQEKANAEKMAKLAKEAEEKAAKSGKASDKRAAEQAKRRAELAASTAQSAEKKAQEAAKPVAALEETARQSEINNAKYEQETSKQAAKDAETAIKKAQAKAKTAAEEARKALDEANAKARQAAQSNDDNDILAARQAAVEARQKQKEAQEAQKKIDEEIRRRNEAEMAYYAASTRQAELEEAKKTTSSSKSNNSGTYSGNTVFAASSTNSSVTGSGGGSQNTLVTAKKSAVINQKDETTGTTAPLTRAAAAGSDSDTPTRSANLVTSGTSKAAAATAASGSGEAYKPTSGGGQLVNAQASKQIISDKATMQIVSGGNSSDESTVANSAASSSSSGSSGGRRIRIPTSSAVAMSSGGSGASSGSYRSGARSVYQYGNATGYASSGSKANAGSVSNSATGAKSQNVQKEMAARAAAFRAKQDELMRKEAEKEALMMKQAEIELRAQQSAAAEQALQERLRQTDEEKIKELTAGTAESEKVAETSSSAALGAEAGQPANPKVLPRPNQSVPGNIPLAQAL